MQTQQKHAGWGRFGWLAVFSRTTSSGSFIPEIDGLRCIAITAVILFHLAGYVAEKSPRPVLTSPIDRHFYQLLRTGHIGVQLFFILSGFVVSLPFALHYLSDGKRVDLRRYFIRRLTRIEPPYVIALIFWLLAFGISGMGEAPFPVLIRHFPASLFYVHNIIYHQPSFVMPPAWSLEIEIQFYLLAPLLALVFCINGALARRLILLTVIAAFAFAQRWLRPRGEANGLNLLQEAHYFLIGLLLVDFYVSGWRNLDSRYPLAADLLATTCLVTLPVVLVYRGDDQALIAGLLMLFVGSVLRGHYWRRVLRNSWIYTFGGMCYTTYLYHGFFKALAGHFTIRWQIGHTFWLNFVLQAVMLIPIIVAGTAVLFVLTEKPFMRRSQARSGASGVLP